MLGLPPLLGPDESFRAALKTAYAFIRLTEADFAWTNIQRIISCVLTVKTKQMQMFHQAIFKT